MTRDGKKVLGKDEVVEMQTVRCRAARVQTGTARSVQKQLACRRARQESSTGLLPPPGYEDLDAAEPVTRPPPAFTASGSSRGG